MRFVPLLSVVLLASCYSPQIGPGKFKCSSTDQCPAPLVCGGGLCVDADGRDLAGDDQGRADQGGVEPPDLRPDPCAAGWIDLAGPAVYACRRTLDFRSGDWSNLCRSSYHACEARDSAALGQAGLAGKCAAAGRFFAARMDVGLSNTSSSPRQADGDCMPSGQGRGLLGCGSDGELYALRNGSCGGLAHAASCSSEPSGWQCSFSSGAGGDVSYGGTQGGVLCCKD